MENEIQAFFSRLESQPDYAQSTRLAYRSDMLAFYNFLWKKLRRSPSLADFTAQNVTAFLEEEQFNGRRPGTILRRRATLRRFERFLTQEGLLPDGLPGPCTRLMDLLLPGLSSRKPPFYLSDEQVRQLWSCLEASRQALARRDHALLAMLLETGMPVSKLIAIDLNEVDLRAGKVYLPGLGGEGRWMSLGSSAEAVAAYLKDGRPELKNSDEGPALFISQVGTRLTRQSVWQVLRRWGKAAQLPVLLSPRLLRHTAARRMARAGRPLAEIQALLGHRNPLSTQALLQRLETGQGTNAAAPRAGSAG